VGKKNVNPGISGTVHVFLSAPVTLPHGIRDVSSSSSYWRWRRLAVVGSLMLIFILKNYRFKYTCNDDNSIGRKKQQKLAYRVVTCKFPITSLQCHDVLTI